MSDVRQRLPEELENIPPGPRLASLLASVDRRALSGKDRVRLLQARHRLAAHMQGELYADMYAISRDEPAPEPDLLSADEPAEPYPWAATEISFALRWTHTAASVRLEQARRMIEDLPAVAAALRAGVIDVPKALVCCDEVCGLAPQLARRIVDRLIGKAPELTTGQLRAKLRRLVIAADPDAALRRAKAAVAGRRVAIEQEHSNLASISGFELLPHRVAAGYERLTAIARAAKAAGDSRRMDELRADAMLDLLIGEGIAVGGPITHGGLEPAPDSQANHDADAHLTNCAGSEPPGSGGGQRRRSGHPGKGHLGNGNRGDSTRGGASLAGQSGVDPALLVCQPDAGTPWPQAPADPDLLDPAADPPVAPGALAAAGTGTTDGVRPWSSTLPEEPAHLDGDPTIEPDHEKLRSYWLAGFDQLPTSRPSTCTHCGQGAPQRGPVPAPRRGSIDLQMSLTTLLGLDDLPAELAGYGPLLADIARQVVDQRPDLQLRFSVYNELDSLLVHGTTKARPTTGPPGASDRRTSRRPSPAVAALVRARNRTCAAPGCRVPSLRCELDHVLAWSQHGQTEPDNLDPACRRHHRFKHTPGTQLVAFTPGTFGWQTPLGMQYLSRPDPPLYGDHRYIHPPQPGDN